MSDTLYSTSTAIRKHKFALFKLINNHVKRVEYNFIIYCNFLVLSIKLPFISIFGIFSVMVFRQLTTTKLVVIAQVFTIQKSSTDSIHRSKFFGILWDELDAFNPISKSCMRPSYREIDPYKHSTSKNHKKKNIINWISTCIWSDYLFLKSLDLPN